MVGFAQSKAYGSFIVAAPLGNQYAAKGRRWADAIDRALGMRSRVDGIQALDALAEKLLVLADQGDLGALKELGDRIDGKAPQAITGPDGGPIQIQTIERRIIDPKGDNG